MADREKVLKGLQCCIDSLKARCPECPYYPCYDEDTTSEKLLADALELLKEQPDVVRCKDCKYWHDPLRCQLDSEGLKTTEDWFCADGERR